MTLPVLHPPISQHSYVRGDVIIHPSAAIAPGVILQAGPGGRIVIAAGVCVGMGTILNACQGTLEIEEGVNLGAGVLVVGQGRIGANTCIGSSSTIFNSSIDRDQMLPAGSIIGDTSRRWETRMEQRQEDELRATDTVILSDSVVASAESIPAEAMPAEAEPSIALTPDPALADPTEAPSEVQPGSVSVYGKVYVSQLMVKLLPNRQPIQPPDQALPGDPWDE